MNPNTDVVTAKKRRLLLPWETGFAGLVLGNSLSRSSSFHLPLLTPHWEPEFLRAAAVLDTEPIEMGSVTKTGMAVHSGDITDSLAKVGKRRVPTEWSKKLTDDRCAALSRWDLLVHQNLEGSRLGKQIASLTECASKAESTAELFEDTFAGKATGTVHQRGGSLLFYSRW